MRQQNFSLPVMDGVISSAGATANVPDNGSTETVEKPIVKSGETVKELDTEPLAADELPDNNFLDTDAW